MKDYLLHTLAPGDFEELVVKICHQILGFGVLTPAVPSPTSRGS